MDIKTFDLKTVDSPELLDELSWTVSVEIESLMLQEVIPFEIIGAWHLAAQVTLTSAVVFERYLVVCLQNNDDDVDAAHRGWWRYSNGSHQTRRRISDRPLAAESGAFETVG